MDHGEAQDRFSEYREKSLSAAEARAVREHLETCGLCRSEYEAFVSTLSELSRLKSQGPAPSAEFLPSLQEAIRRRSRGRFFSKRASRFPLEMVSLITLLIMLVLYLFMIAIEPRKVREKASRPHGAAEQRDPASRVPG